MYLVYDKERNSVILVKQKQYLKSLNQKEAALGTITKSSSALSALDIVLE